jgi:multiple sugar transport system permease protein
VTNHRLIPYLFALPAVLVMALGLAWPVIESLRLSMYELRLGETITPQAFRGFSIFLEALADPSVHTSWRWKC